MSDIVALAAVVKLAAVAGILSTLELLTVREIVRDRGLMSWKVARTRNALLGAGRSGWFLDALLGYPRFLLVVGVRLVACLVIVAATPRMVESPWLLTITALTTLLFVVRSYYGLDGADQMVTILFVAAALFSVVGTAGARSTFLTFVAFQGWLAYTTSGFAKLIARGWRDGSYLIRICATTIYGNRAIGRWLEARPAIARWLARGVIFWECSCVVMPVAPLPLVVALLTLGLAFHVTNALIMGLNTFLWAFLATYPAILWWAMR